MFSIVELKDECLFCRLSNAQQECGVCHVTTTAVKVVLTQLANSRLELARIQLQAIS